MHHPIDRITHTTAFGTPVVEHWLEREIAQWVHPMKDRSDDPSHHERTLLPRSYISLLTWWGGLYVSLSRGHRQVGASASDRAVVLSLGSIEPQGFVEAVSGVRVRQRSRILRLFSTIPVNIH